MWYVVDVSVHLLTSAMMQAQLIVVVQVVVALLLLLSLLVVVVVAVRLLDIVSASSLGLVLSSKSLLR